MTFAVFFRFGIGNGIRGPGRLALRVVFYPLCATIGLAVFPVMGFIGLCHFREFGSIIVAAGACFFLAVLRA
jgi:hypothetical protein